MADQQEGLFRRNLSSRPLAEKLRPSNIEEMILPRGIQQAQLDAWTANTGLIPSLIFWGPPGAGKTTLARVLGSSMKADFRECSAVSIGVKEIRAIVEDAKRSPLQPLLFLDEVHRFNKAQQDVLLPWIENGTISFIGATTENPSFALNSALLSRCTVFHLPGFIEEDLQKLLERALNTVEIKLNQEESQQLIKLANGDARFLIRIVESYAKEQGQGVSLEDHLRTHPTFRYDRSGDEHYNTISAFIKSMRSGDANSALYFAVKMIKAGEDPKFIFRRMIIFASEDIGNAQPQALMIANQAAEAYDRIGLPEGNIILSQAICFLATAPKSRASYNALRNTENFLEEHPNISVPLSLRNKEPKGMGSDERQQLTNSSKILKSQEFYQPTDSGYEKKL